MNWRDLILNNLRWKLFSLLIAMIIWSTYHTGEEGIIDIGGNLFEDKVTKEFHGKRLQLMSEPDISRIVTMEPEFIMISLRGSPEVMKPFTITDVLAYVDVSNLPSGTTNKIPISVKVPAGIKVDSLRPTNVTVRIIEKASVAAETVSTNP